MTVPAASGFNPTDNSAAAAAVVPIIDVATVESASLQPPSKSLKARVVQGSAVTMAGFGAAQLLRVVSSVVLTRLLNREAYGLYRLANVFLEGLAYFTAIGSGPAVIRDERGDDPTFLNTAWTLQSLRGVGLFLAACLLAAPYAWFYRQPVLWFLIPVVAITVLLDSFDSVAMYWCQRHMKLAAVTILEFLRQLTALLVTISFALISPTVWAFPAGAITGCILVLILSHLALPGPKSRFQFNREAAHSQFHFGKWIFASSAMEFVAQQLDILFLGRFVGIGQVGVYGVAVNLSQMLATLNMRLSRQVLFPAFSITFRQSAADLSRVFYRARLAIDLLHLPALGIAMMAGSGFVKLLLGHRFWDAGWIFQILCVRAAMKCLFNPLSNCCVAINKTHCVAASTVARVVWAVIAIPVGWYCWGFAGVVWATALSELPVLVILYWALWRARIVQFARELLPLAMVGSGCVLGWILSHFLPRL